jgi:hypothetical protein
MSFHLRFGMPSDPRFLAIARAAVGELSRIYGLPDEECRGVTLAIDEALANIIRHAYKNRDDQRIEFNCDVNAEQMEFTLQIFQRHTDLIEPLSLDEAYLDVTENKTGLPTATRVAKAIRQQIRDELQLTASAGVAPNKFHAKIASDWRKPDGLFVIQPEEVQRFLPPLPVGRIPGVGKVTETRLKANEHPDGPRLANFGVGSTRSAVWALRNTPLRTSSWD